MKRVFSGILLLALLMVLLSALPLGASAFDDGTMCMAVQNGQHDWRSIDYTAPTCSQEGSRTYQCRNCKKTATETLPTTSHTSTTVTEYPTCTEAGSRWIECSVCHQKLTNPDYLPPLGHDWEHQHRDPTCTEDGYDHALCRRCGEVDNPIILPALGHIPETAPAKAPTCTEAGLTEGTRCARCGQTLTQQQSIPALGHIPVTAPGKAATCTEAGTTGATVCDRCGALLQSGQALPALGHIPVTAPGKAATCTEAGATGATVCDRCGALLQSGQVLPALGHAFSEWKEESKGTCAQQGLDRRVCSRCGLEEYRYNGFGPHQFQEASRTEPTCYDEGSVIYACKNCGETLTEKFPPLGHDWGPWVTVEEPNAVQDGYRQRVCRRDPSHVEEEDLPARGLYTLKGLKVHFVQYPDDASDGFYMYSDGNNRYFWQDEEPAKESYGCGHGRLYTDPEYTHGLTTPPEPGKTYYFFISVHNNTAGDHSMDFAQVDPARVDVTSDLFTMEYLRMTVHVGEPVDDSDRDGVNIHFRVTCPGVPALSLTDLGDTDGEKNPVNKAVYGPNDSVYASHEVKNTGNVPLIAAIRMDTQPEDVIELGQLAPGETLKYGAGFAILGTGIVPGTETEDLLGVAHITFYYAGLDPETKAELCRTKSITRDWKVGRDAEEKFVLKGLELHYTDVEKHDLYGYSLTSAEYHLHWQGEEPDLSRYWVYSGRLYTDIAETHQLAADPAPGETYYFTMGVSCKTAGDHAIDFSQVDPAQVLVTSDQFSLKLLGIDAYIGAGGGESDTDSADIHFAATCLGAAGEPKPAIQLEVTWDEDAGVGKRYEGAVFPFYIKLTNIGNCPVYDPIWPPDEDFFDYVYPGETVFIPEMTGFYTGNFAVINPGESWAYTSMYWPVKASDVESGVYTGQYEDSAHYLDSDGEYQVVWSNSASMNVPLTYPADDEAKFVLKGLSRHYAGWLLSESGNYYLSSSGFGHLIWKDDQSAPTEPYMTEFFTDPGLTTPLKEDPVPGGVYYIQYGVENAYANDHSIDFTQVDPALVDMTSDGFDIELLSITPHKATDGYDDVILLFKLNYNGGKKDGDPDGLKPQITATLSAAPDAGVGKRYSGATFHYLYQLTNTGNCPVYVEWREDYQPNIVYSDTSTPHERIEIDGITWGGNYTGVTLLNPGETYSVTDTFFVNDYWAEQDKASVQYWVDFWYYDEESKLSSGYTYSNRLFVDLTYPEDGDKKDGGPGGEAKYVLKGYTAHVPVNSATDSDGITKVFVDYADVEKAIWEGAEPPLLDSPSEDVGYNFLWWPGCYFSTDPELQSDSFAQIDAKAGEVYYTYGAVRNAKPFDHSIDFSQVDPSLINVTIDGFQVELLSVESKVHVVKYDMAFMIFKVTYLGDGATGTPEEAKPGLKLEMGLFADQYVLDMGALVSGQEAAVLTLPESISLDYLEVPNTGNVPLRFKFVITTGDHAEKHYTGEFFSGTLDPGRVYTASTFSYTYDVDEAHVIPDPEDSPYAGTYTETWKVVGYALDDTEYTTPICESNAVTFEFKIAKDDGPHPAIDVKIWADPDAGEGKRYVDAQVPFHYEVTNTGDCPVYVPWWPNAVDASAPNGLIEVAGMGWDKMGVALLNPGETYTDTTIYSVHAGRVEKGYIHTRCSGDAWYYDTDGEIQQIWTDSNWLTIDLTYPPDHEPEPVKPALNITWRFDRVFPNPGIDTGMYKTTEDKLYEPHVWVTGEFDILNAGNVPLYVKVYCSLGNGLTSETKWPGGRDEYTFQPGETQLSGWGVCPLSDYLTPGTETAELLGTVDITMWAKGFDLKTGKELCTSNEITRSWKVRKDGAGTPEPDPGESQLTVKQYESGSSADPAGYQLGEEVKIHAHVTNTGTVDIPAYTVDKDFVGKPGTPAKSSLPIGTMAIWGISTTLDPVDGWVYYTVQPEDVDRGYIYFPPVKAHWTDPETGANRSAISEPVTVNVISKTGLLLKKDVAFGPKNGSFYQEGEPVQWTLTVTNNSKEPIKNVVVTDQGVTVGTFAEIAPGDTRTCYVPVHIVTAYEADVVGYVSNVASATGEDVQGIAHTWQSNEMKVPTNAFSPIPVPHPGIDTGDGIPGGGGILPGGGDGIFDPGYPGGSIFDPLTPIIGANTGAAVVKADAKGPGNGTWYEKDETIEYTITVKNVGETTLTNLALYDSLGGLSPIGTLSSLAPDEAHAFPFSYQVPIEEGCIVNTAILTYTAEGLSGTPVKSNPVYSQVGKNGFVPTDGGIDGGGGIIIGGIDGGGIIGGGIVTGDDGATHPYFPGLHPYDPSGDPDGGDGGETKDQKDGMGKDFCALELIALGDNGIRYTLHTCEEHQAAAQQAETMDAKEACALWRAEIDALYETLYAAGSDQGKAAVLNDRIAFWAFADAFSALRQDDQALCDLLRLRCAELCCMIHTAPDALPGSLLSDYATLLGGLGNEARCRQTLDPETGDVVLTLDADHAQALTDTLRLLNGAGRYAQDSALRSAQYAWQSALDALVNEAYRAADRDGRKLIAAWRQALDRMITARENLLSLLYVDAPEVPAEAGLTLYRDALVDACAHP